MKTRLRHLGRAVATAIAPAQLLVLTARKRSANQLRGANKRFGEVDTSVSDLPRRRCSRAEPSTCSERYSTYTFATPETRPRPSERLIELYRKGKIAEAFRAFKKIYLEIVDEVIDHLKGQETGHSVR